MYRWETMSFLNTTVGIDDPSVLDPPDDCAPATRRSQQVWAPRRFSLHSECDSIFFVEELKQFVLFSASSWLSASLQENAIRLMVCLSHVLVRDKVNFCQGCDVKSLWHVQEQKWDTFLGVHSCSAKEIFVMLFILESHVLLILE